MKGLGFLFLQSIISQINAQREAQSGRYFTGVDAADAMATTFSDNLYTTESILDSNFTAIIIEDSAEHSDILNSAHVAEYEEILDSTIPLNGTEIVTVTDHLEANSFATTMYNSVGDVLVSSAEQINVDFKRSQETETVLISELIKYETSSIANPAIPTEIALRNSKKDKRKISRHYFDVISEFAASSFCSTIFDKKEYVCEEYCTEGTYLVDAFRADDHIGNSSFYVAVNKKLKAVIISFTGTNSSIHWDINTKAKLRPIFWQAEPLPFLTEEKITAYVGMKMHYGFQTMYEGSRIQMLQTLYDLSFKIDFKDHEIIFTGFSMGGALAQIAAGDFYEVLGYGDRISLYTFGQPRIGNRLYAIYYGKLPFAERIYRIVRRGDLVPHVPPFSSYFHIKQAYQILDNGDVITCDNLYNDGTGEVAGSCSGDFPFKIIYNNHRDYYGIRRACRD